MRQGGDAAAVTSKNASVIERNQASDPSLQVRTPRRIVKLPVSCFQMLCERQRSQRN